MSVIHLSGSDAKLSFYECALLGQVCCESGVCLVSVENCDYPARVIKYEDSTIQYVIAVCESSIVLNELMANKSWRPSYSLNELM